VIGHASRPRRVEHLRATWIRQHASVAATVVPVGDDACWLDRTCLACGRFLDADHADDERCPHCGAERVVERADGAAES
jgi:rubrerythrin